MLETSFREPLPSTCNIKQVAQNHAFDFLSTKISSVLICSSTMLGRVVGETRAIKSKHGSCIPGAYSPVGETDINQQIYHYKLQQM